ncbi:MAG: M20/M25/M40 family metallo-hydrolase [Pyrinomonadaceae bacterium]
MKKKLLEQFFSRQFSAALLSIILLSSIALARLPQTAAPPRALSLSIEERDISASVKVDTIKEITAALSAAEMEGRGTMQPGGDKAADYIAARFAKLGLKPLGSRGYLQSIKFRETDWLPETSFKIGEGALKFGSDFVVTPPYSGDKSVSGQMVFVAFGLISNVPKRDDLAGIDVKGKIVVLLEGPPRSVDKPSWKKARPQITIIRNLVLLGASGLVFVNTGTTEHPYSEMADYLTRRQLERADGEEMPSFLPPFITLSNEAATKLFEGSEVTFSQALERAEQDNFKPISLKQSAKITVRLKKAKGLSNNVVGLLEGSDPKLKAEALVYTAHYDAYGVGQGNRVYPGAADNALGVAEMIAVAEALTRSTSRPRRSIIFLAVTGEEYGGYGSSYWVENPTWKIKQVAANLNFDGMGTEVYGPVKTLVGFGAEHSSLGTLLNDVAVASGLRVITDPMPEEKSFYRSDHYFFVKKGVPGLMILGAPEGDVSSWINRLKEWEKTDYHQPTDIIRPEWNWDGPRTIAALGLVLGLRVANQDQMPSWLPQSPFNRERGTNEPPPPEP